jgi:uncharacterized tellurite resistance protein B-like protein
MRGNRHALRPLIFRSIYPQAVASTACEFSNIAAETPMLDGLRQFIADVVSPAAHQDRAFDDTGYRLAATALLIHVISLDGEPSEVEKRKLHSLLESRFGLDPGTADKLIASATLVEGEAVDLYHFTSVIMRSVNEEGRLRIVEMMWELVYADGQVSEFEDNVVWRAADLLGVSSRDRIDLKHRVAGEQRTPASGGAITGNSATGSSDVADAAT